MVCGASWVRASGTLWVMQHRDQLAQGIDRQPQPQCVGAVRQARSELVELDVRQVELPQDAVVKRRAVFTRPRQPAGNRRVRVAEDPRRGRDRQPLCQCCQDFATALGGGFQTVEWRIATRAKGGPTRLAAQGLDALAREVRAISDQGVDLRVGQAIVLTGAIGAGKPLCGDALGCAAAAFALTPGRHRWTGRSGCGLVRALLATGWAIVGGAGLE
jgi:hypothetical protein